ncbi:hypothetical protein [Mesorhizobium sp. 65-26]|uniref:hypothetical protein n=1 Tax=Mesorhizobium sp. 65-26 TaxID=1895781 RepID=UPI00086E3336|nr:hypothetical protein [Mesorhizobium sp. 65-26]ODT31282.1 MAG: hypothetical protein ABS35_05255 [Kaistia sp. SCN 65-12]OJX76452.1 MAG: hypothetical protein BGO93_31370 [Mesorhizobium sp. 65-26]
MKLIVKGVLAGLVAFIGFGPVSSFAQDASCGCATAYRGPGNPVGSIRQVQGDVAVSQAAGYDSAKVGSALDFGSRVVVGPKGSALVQSGGCNVAVPANSSLDISRVGDKVCLKVLGSEQTAAVPGASNQSGGGGFKFGPPEAIFAGALITSGVLAATQDDDNGVSR